jgi:hypothetical protein
VNKRLAVLALLFAIAVPLHADHFSKIAGAIGSKPGIKRVWIPFLGVARLAVNIARPEGVYDFQLATFEGKGKLDAWEFEPMMRKLEKDGYKPLVKVWSRKGEWTFIYVKPRTGGKRLELYVLAHDGDTTLVRVDVDADMVGKYLEQPRTVTRVAAR